MELTLINGKFNRYDYVVNIHKVSEYACLDRESRIHDRLVPRAASAAEDEGPRRQECPMLRIWILSIIPWLLGG